MTSPRLIPSLLLAAVLGLSACSGGSDAAIPRRKAYPRIAVADTLYRPVEGFGVRFEANEATVVLPDTATRAGATDGSQWLTLAYPCYGDARLFLTLTPVADAESLERVLDNRIERMSLNNGSADYELTELLTPSGFNCQLVVAHASTVTPVQLLAFDNRRVLTGALYLPAMATADPDSIAPVVDAVAADMIHALKHLQ